MMTELRSEPKDLLRTSLVRVKVQSLKRNTGEEPCKFSFNHMNEMILTKKSLFHCDDIKLGLRKLSAEENKKVCKSLAAAAQR